jgi:perosamine synthetase
VGVSGRVYGAPVVILEMEPVTGSRADVPFLPFARPDLGPEEVDAVRDVLMGGWVTSGERCRELEEAVATTLGVTNAVAVSSCTAALHLSLEAAGVGPGDLVVTTPYTFASTAEVIHHLDAVPVFVDIDPETFNIDPAAVVSAMEGLARGDRAWLPPALRDTATARTPAAVIPVHVAGVPCDLDDAYAAAARLGLAVVEDAAHADPTAPRPADTVAERRSVRSTACYSFYATKPVTTGEGGMLVTDDDAIAQRARVMRLHGLSRDPWDRQYHPGGPHYEVVAAGFKYNLTDIAAAIGLVQMRKAGAMRERRQQIARHYNDAFAGCELLQVPAAPPGVDLPWHLYMVRIAPGQSSARRDQLVEALRDQGIGTSIHFVPLHHHRHYRETYGYSPDDFPVATRESEREISLPIYSAMSDTDVERVVTAVLTALSAIPLGR